MLKKEYETLTHKSSRSPYLNRLKDLVITLSDFFEAGGSGLDRDQIETKEYRVCCSITYLVSHS